MSSPSTPFQLSFRVEAADIDEQGHVNNIVYLRWVQEIATAHWKAVASLEDQAAVFWVVLRHEIDYKAAAFVGDEILVQTRVGEAARLSFERLVEIGRASDQKVLALARTFWCPMSVQTKLPHRVSKELRAQFSTNAN